MDDTMNRLAREMAEAIAAAVAGDAQVEACRRRARLAGYDLRVSLEANIGFAPWNGAGGAADGARRPLAEITAADRRFLRSLRIAVDETAEEV